MRSFEYHSSPVLVLPPQLPPQPSFNMESNRPTFSSPFSSGSNNHQLHINSSWSNLTPTIPAPSSAAGRKRSRDEAGANLEEDYFPVQAPILPQENEDEWEYGEGMTLIKKSRGGIALEAGSQTGTWAEEKAEEEKAKALALAAAAIPVLERSILRATKSQRLNLSSTPSICEEVVHNGTLVSPGSPERNGLVEPTVDDFTRHLGIGWSSINNADADIQAAARGWSKFIENHYPVSDAKIRLQSKGLASYLVEANEGYFLFGEDLKQGRLVSTSLDKTWVNLRGPAPVFDGDVVMEACETPRSDSSLQPMLDQAPTDGMMNGMNGTLDANMAMTNGHEIHGSGGVMNGVNDTMEVEMDMS